jgi:hypothetical protein
LHQESPDRAGVDRTGRCLLTYRPIKDGPRIPVRLAWWHDHRPNGLGDLVDAVTQLYAAG